jgi:hypothetical protein
VAPQAPENPAAGECDEQLLAQFNLQPVTSGAPWHPIEVLATHLAFAAKPAAHRTLRSETIDQVASEYPLTGALLRRRGPRAIKRRAEKPGFARAQDDGTPHPLQSLARAVLQNAVQENDAYRQCVAE